MKLNGRVALVTGGARRVGRAIVLELARAGCDVAIHYYHSENDAAQLADSVTSLGRRNVTIQGDLSDPKSWANIIARTVDALGRIDVLVNNASAFETPTPDTIAEFDRREWEAMLRTNLVAPMALCHHARPYLEDNDGGHIINLCDIWSERPSPSHLAYASSKAALASLTKGLARALAPRIQVNGVAPGIAAFPEHYTDETRNRLIDRVPLRRAGTPEDVARLVRFLVESGDYITGQIVPIDGGRNLV